MPHFERPVELTRLSMAEKFPIRRCSNYVPPVHLSNGIFALKGHCVTFLQDISAMCNELPLCKETMVVFIRYLGNKDTSAVYPKSLCVNRKNVLEALLWLKKTQSFLRRCLHKRGQLGMDTGWRWSIDSLKCREIQNKELKAIPNHR